MCQLSIRLDNPVHREVAGAWLPQGRDHPQVGGKRHEGHRHRRRVQDRINRRGNLLDEISNSGSCKTVKIIVMLVYHVHVRVQSFTSLYLIIISFPHTQSYHPFFQFLSSPEGISIPLFSFSPSFLPSISFYPIHQLVQREVDAGPCKDWNHWRGTFTY